MSAPFVFIGQIGELETTAKKSTLTAGLLVAGAVSGAVVGSIAGAVAGGHGRRIGGAVSGALVGAVANVVANAIVVLGTGVVVGEERSSDD